MTTLDRSGRSLDQAEDELLAAMRASDVAALGELIADDLVFTTPDGSVIDKATDLEAHRSGTTRFERLTEVRRRTTARAHAGTTESVVDAVVLDHGRRIEAVIRYERAWRIVDGRWQVTAGSASPVT